MLLDLSHLLHHVHEVPHATELLQESRVNCLLHLLHKLLRVTLHGLQVVLIVTEVHLAHFLNHVLEFMIFLQKQDNFLRVSS